jgi:hypothetical protein
MDWSDMASCVILSRFECKDPVYCCYTLLLCSSSAKLWLNVTLRFALTYNCSLSWVVEKAQRKEYRLFSSSSVVAEDTNCSKRALPFTLQFTSNLLKCVNSRLAKYCCMYSSQYRLHSSLNVIAEELNCSKRALQNRDAVD